MTAPGRGWRLIAIPVDISQLEPSAANAEAFFPPTKIGPCWQKNPDGSWLLPEKTLGWEIAGWVAEWLTLPDGTPFKFTLEQLRLVLWIYAVDATGRFIYRHVFLQRLKGWGKDPLAAVLCVVELVGPSQFSHWDAKGDPVGKANPQAYVQIAAVSLEQTENTRDFFPSLLPKRTREAFQMEVQKEIIYAHGGRVKCKAVGANPRSLEGGRPTFLVAGEPHHWTKSNGGQKFYRTSMNNLTKSRFQARMLVITNAYEPGEESVAESIRLEQEQVWAGLKEPTGWLYDSLEAHPDAPLTKDWAPFIVQTIKGDSWWLNTDDIVTAIQDGSIPPSTHRRFWYNQIVASEDRVYSEGDWKGIQAPGCLGTKADLQPGDSITMGFDGGSTDDATALVAIRIRDRLIVPLAIWQRPDTTDRWEVNRYHVDSAVHEAFATYDVQAFFCDRALWESYIDKWRDEYGEKLLVKATGNHSLVFDMRGNKAALANGHEALIQHVVDKRIWHNGDRLLRIHALNAVRHHNGVGVVPFKESPESPRKIDAYVAALLAFLALQKLLEARKEREPVYDNTLYQF